MSHDKRLQIESFKQKEWFSVEQCNRNYKSLYIFGDNTIRKGNAGQAGIRNCSNSYGIATKHLPSIGSSSYFSDDDISSKEIIDLDIDTLIKFLNSDENQFLNIIFPGDGLGTGLSDMQNKCPELLKHLNDRLKTIFGINYGS